MSDKSAVTPEERTLTIRDTAEYVRKYLTNEAWASTPMEVATAIVDGFVRYFTNRTSGSE